MESRRDLLKGIGVAAVVAATPSMLSAKPQDLPGRGRGGREIGFGSIEKDRFSTAVADGVFTAFSAFVANRDDRANTQVAAHAWKVAKDHFNENGLMRASDQLLREADVNEALARLSDMPQELARIAEKHGATLDVVRLQERIAALTPDRVSEAMAFLKSGGSVAAFDNLSSVFDDVMNGRTPRKPGGGVGANVDGCQYLAMIEAALWILSGMYAVGCAVTLSACVACCVAAAVLALAAGVLDLIGAYYC
jgi:hypothetical protein